VPYDAPLHRIFRATYTTREAIPPPCDDFF